MKLDLASGLHPAEGFDSVDENGDCNPIWVVNLLDFPWPWANDSADELRCSHFIEHIPATNRVAHGTGSALPKDFLFHFFDEAYRVLKPGGIFTVIWPHFRSVDAFQDPTHRRFLPVEFLRYLSVDGRKQLGVSHYRVECDWQIQDVRKYHRETVPDAPVEIFQVEAILRKPETPNSF